MIVYCVVGGSLRIKFQNKVDNFWLQLFKKKLAKLRLQNVILLKK